MVFIFLVLAIVAAFHFGYKNKIFSFPAKSEVVGKIADASPSASPAAPDASWPIPLNNPSVTAVYAHYYFSGKIKEINKTDKGSEIVLETADEKIPHLLVDKETRYSRISLPYSTATMRPIKFGDIVQGMVIDVSVEYDIRGKSWIVRDVYVPDDRN